MRYRQAARHDFDAIAATNGAVYHQRGGYELVEDQQTFVPVNRSYRQFRAERTGKGETRQLSRDNYTNRDRVIGDNTNRDLELIGDEHLIDIYGKSILCLGTSNGNVWQEFSTDPVCNPNTSEEASLLIAQLREQLERTGLDVSIGIFGSHQIGLNRTDSDLDLIAYTPREMRSEVINVLAEIFRYLGYASVNELPEILGKYAERYAQRMGLPAKVGVSLARDRLRWISSNGVSTSLQCIHSDYDHAWAQQVVDGGLKDAGTTSRGVFSGVEIFDKSESYNFPRLWKVVIAGEESDVVSFDWAHQGMGSSSSEVYTMRAQRVMTTAGKTAYILSQQSDFILPTRLVE